MGWRIEIGGTVPITIDSSLQREHARFNLRTVQTKDDAGVVQFVETFIDVEGDVVELIDEDNADRIAQIRNAVATNISPQTVTIKLNGTPKWSFSPLNCVAGSPYMQAFQTDGEEGNGDSHWRYSFTIYIKQPGGGDDSEEDVFEIQTALKVIKESNRIVRKVWRASVKGKTLALALSKALSFKPSDDHLHEEVERLFNERKVVVLWVWDARQEKDVIEIIEDPAVITGRGRHYVWSQQVNDPDQFSAKRPILHEARSVPTKIVITGRVRGYDPVKVAQAVPPAHYSETNDIKRQEAEEMHPDEATLVDIEKGIYEIQYQEIWLITTNQIPKAKHDGHGGTKPAKFADAPADGPMANQGV